MKQLSTVIILSLICLFSCKKDFLNTSLEASLLFSTDSILFDTVFTSIGSSTQRLKAYNKNEGNIIISSIFLAGGENSSFRININGQSSSFLTDVELLHNDSLYIFIEVTVDPNNQNNPLVIMDSIIFLTNENEQTIHLTAWGQDAHFYTPNDSLLLNDNTYFYYHNILNSYNFTSDKPHVIYGYMGVSPNNSLTISPGSKIHFHANSGLIIFNDASLKCNGAFNNHIVFEGDRLESYYDEVPGQWDRIWLSAGSINNEITYTTIKNGTIGLQVDTIGVSSSPTVIIKNCIIKNMSAIGLFGQGTNLAAENLIISNCGQYNLVCNIGGFYDFKHCTFTNYWNYSNRTTPTILLNNWYEDLNGNIIVRDLENAIFSNCIIYGNIEEEVAFDKQDGASFNYYFDHSLLKAPYDTDTTNSNHFNNIILNQDPNFLDIVNQDFQLDTLSPAKDAGEIRIANLVPEDILLVNRLLDSGPDMGAYERVE